jgi:2-keto-4-pentenoate hydratase/2-oxohepta-3-ene-1,7-dioic acid hydratase in catechol pathway
VVIGRRCRYVSESEALSVIGGYTIFNDVTVRDYQRRTPQWTAGKNFVATGPLGPHVVPRSDVADPHGLELTVTVNGEVMQHTSTSQMIFRIETLIAHVSEFTQLEPGDVIATGTPSGVGFARTPPRFLRPGDHVAVAIEGIGVLENTVIDELDTSVLAGGRLR